MNAPAPTELRLLIEEYDPQNSDWNFRKGVMLDILDRQAASVGAEHSYFIRDGDKADACARCGHPRKEHSYNGACYGLCGEFVGAEVAGEAVEITHDGFVGNIIGHYVTREGKRGVVLQQVNTKVVHVYGEKWLASPSRSEGGSK